MKKMILILLFPILLFGQYGHSGSGVIILSDTTSASEAGLIYTYSGNYYAGNSSGTYDIIPNPPTGGKVDGYGVIWNNSTERWQFANVTTSNDWYGVSWDIKTDTYTRLGNLADSAASATIPDANLPIQSALRRCVLNNAGNIEYYLKSTNSNLKANDQPANIDTTGGLADGQVVVEIPTFYYYHHYADSVHTWKISQDELPGYTKFSKSYVGAYPAAIYDLSAGVYKGDDADIANTVNDTLCSISGIKPHTNETRAEYRTLAENRGTGWHLLDNRTLQAIQILYLVEYANLNIQSEISEGNTKFTAWDYDADIGPTGKSNSDGNFSGGQSTTNGDSLDYMSYRGIEDIFGNIWQFVDGVNINNDGSSSKLYLCSVDSNYADDISTNYTLYGNLCEVDGYQTNFMDISNGFYPTSIGGSSSTYVCDYYYTAYDSDPSGGWRVYLLGGAANSGGAEGVFCVFADFGSSYSGSAAGARLCFTP